MKWDNDLFSNRWIFLILYFPFYDIRERYNVFHLGVRTAVWNVQGASHSIKSSDCLNHHPRLTAPDSEPHFFYLLFNNVLLISWFSFIGPISCLVLLQMLWVSNLFLLVKNKSERIYYVSEFNLCSFLFMIIFLLHEGKFYVVMHFC